MNAKTTAVMAAHEGTMLPMDDVHRMAVAIAKSGFYGFKTPEQAMALMLVAQAEGHHPAIVARDYDIIQGRPAKKAEAMQRDFLMNGGKIEWHQLDDTCADATFSHPSGGEVRVSWDMSRAKQAGLGTKDNWRKFPRQMLRARCISEGVRTVYPMATSGMYVPEEVRDFEPRQMRDVTPPKPRGGLAAAVEDAAPIDHDADTGEVFEADAIREGFVLATDWRKWGKGFAEAVKGAMSAAELDGLITVNMDMLQGMEEAAPKMSARMDEVISAKRQELEGE